MHHSRLGGITSALLLRYIDQQCRHRSSKDHAPSTRPLPLEYIARSLRREHRPIWIDPHYLVPGFLIIR